MKKILAVDDAPEITEVLDLIMSGEGFQVITLNNANTIFTTVRECTPSAIILDIALGMDDGREYCQALKSSPETANIPVIILSSLVGYHDDNVACNADAYLPKPFEINQLISTVKHFTA